MVSLLALPKASQWGAEPGTTSCRNLALNARGTRWEVDACEVCQGVGGGKREDIPGMEAESNSLSPLTALCCCLNQKVNRCWVAPGGFWSKSGQLSRDTQAKAHARTRHLCIHPQYSSEYSLFLRYIFPAQFYMMCDAVSFASISFASN